MANKVIVQQLRSSALSNDNAKLPTSGDFPSEPQKKYGILAINYHKDQETISTLNDGNEVVAFNYNLNIDTTQNENPTLTVDVFNAIKTAKSISFNNEWFITQRAIDTQNNTLNLFGGKVDGEKIDYIKIAINRENYTVEIKSGSGDFLDNTVIPNINQQLIDLNKNIESVSNAAISVKSGDGIVISGDGTEKTISTNVQLKIVKDEGQEKLQIVDGTDNSKILAEVDASAFVVDGMLSSAEIVTVDDEPGSALTAGKYIKLSWNTDAGKLSDTYISVADLISEHQVIAGEAAKGDFITVTTNVDESTNENGVKISTVSVSVDDTAVKTALDNKADQSVINDLKSSSHTHSNKDVLDKLTQDVIDDSHTHSNKDELDKIDVGDITKYSVNGLKFQKEGAEYKINIEGENINVPYPYGVVRDMSIFDSENENNVEDLLIAIDDSLVFSIQSISDIFNYTVNGKKISENPELVAGDLAVTPNEKLVATNVQSALEELQNEIGDLNEAIESVSNAAISVKSGDGIVISGDGTEKTISTNVQLKIVKDEGQEKLQIVDGTDNSKILAEVDASAFVVDGMLSSAEIVTVDDETELPEGVELSNGKYIKLSWNTDAGKLSDTYISVADLISEHQVIAGEDVAGEFVVVTTNVVESTDENGIKVSTVNVTVDDTAVKTALDNKADKTTVEEIQTNIGDFYTKTQVNSLITSEKNRAVAEEDSIKQALSDTEEVISNTLVTFKDSIGLDEYGKFIIDSQETNVKTVIEDIQTEANNLETQITTIEEIQNNLSNNIDKVNYSKDINYAVNTSMNFISRCADDVFTSTANQYTLPTYYYAKGLKTGDVITITFDIEIDNTVWNYTTEDATEHTGEISIQFGPAYSYMGAQKVRFTASGKYHSTYTTTVTDTKDITEDICGYLYIRYSYVKSIDNTQPMVKISNLCIIKGEEDKGWFPSVFDNEYNIGCNTHTLTYTEIIPTSKRLCYVNINGTSSTVGMYFQIANSLFISDKDTTALIHNGQENHFIFYNSTSQDVTLLFPNRDNIVLLSGSNITISANSYAEVNCLMVDEGRTDGLTNQGKMYIRAMV